MTYFSDLHTYLHQSSLLLQAYPTARITAKYSLPRKPNTKGKRPPKLKEPATKTTEAAATTAQNRREPAALLTLKTYDPDSGLCLKYRTDKAAEVGRLLTGLGRLAQGEVIDMPVAPPSTQAGPVDGDKMDVDVGLLAPKLEDKVVTSPPTTSSGTGEPGKGKKKKGKR